MNITMNGQDALCNAMIYTANNDTSIDLRFETEALNNNTNAIWAIFIS